MELGNICFGNSRGRYECPRIWQDRFHIFLDDAGFDSYGNKNDYDDFIWSNDVFKVMPYYWGDCECGFEDLEWKWSEENNHDEDCYQIKYEEISSNDKEVKKLCKEYDLTYPRGSAVHCTCTHTQRWEKFLNENDHKEDCMVIQPNFVHFNTGFQIEWYKYPLRDSYMNMDIDKQFLKEVIKDCMNSIEG